MEKKDSFFRVNKLGGGGNLIRVNGQSLHMITKSISKHDTRLSIQGNFPNKFHITTISYSSETLAEHPLRCR